MVNFVECTATERLWNFEDLPLSRYTLEGLKAAKYTRMTAIQRAALPHSLSGKDVLGAAKTGSGKTLAFIIPVRSCASLRVFLDRRVHTLLFSAHGTTHLGYQVHIRA